MQFEAQTDGIVVRATPTFLPEESAPDEDRFVWAYTIEIENTTGATVQLLTRHWRLTDSDGRTQEVRGEGVVGEQPVIPPGGRFQYTSAAPLSAPSGVMSGSYGMVRVSDGARFAIATPVFPLDSPHARRLAN